MEVSTICFPVGGKILTILGVEHIQVQEGKQLRWEPAKSTVTNPRTLFTGGPSGKWKLILLTKFLDALFQPIGEKR